MSTSEVKCKWVNCSEDLSNIVHKFIRRYMKHVKFVACMAFFITFFHILLVSFLSLYIWLYVLYASL